MRRKLGAVAQEPIFGAVPVFLFFQRNAKIARCMDGTPAIQLYKGEVGWLSLKY